MKNLIILLATVLLFSCSSGIERKAKKHMKETMLELAKNPETFKIDNVKTIINNDSLCVLQFTTRGQNGFGGYSRSSCEYYYVRSKDRDGAIKDYEYVENLDDDKSQGTLKSQAERAIRKYPELKKELNEKEMSEKEKLEYTAYSLAKVFCVISGREIED